MSFLPDFNRRNFIRLAAAAPLLGQIAAKNAYASVATALGKDPGGNVYTRLGVKTVINCRGTWTYLSGSLEFPEVRAAQQQASGHFVNMFELVRKQAWLHPGRRAQWHPPPRHAWPATIQNISGSFLTPPG
jgi:hypothetical protein